MEEQKIALVSPNCSDLAPPSVITKRFPDGESYCRLEGVENISNKKVYILHRLFPNPDENLIILLQIMYGAKKAGASSIELILPYMPYARADKEWLKGEVVSAKLLVKLLKENGADKIYTWDCHFLKKPGIIQYEGLEFVNKCMGEELIATIRKRYKDIVVVSPDAGAKYIVGQSGLFMRKERGGYQNDKNKTHRSIKELEPQFDKLAIEDKIVVLVDDMIAGGGTMIKASEKCYELGAREVICAATHGMFLGDALLKILSRGIKKILTTDTILNPTSIVSIKQDIVNILEPRNVDFKNQIF
ncbi:MAG: ribose-phosphate diphosphokinase [Candidatus Omnitrophica bacterium]|nr:ribose-phosphate diphosphokinase [Candidatus Omnitrophota bacterium]